MVIVVGILSVWDRGAEYEGIRRGDGGMYIYVHMRAEGYIVCVVAKGGEETGRQCLCAGKTKAFD